MSEPTPDAALLRRVADGAAQLRTQIGTIVIGQDAAVRALLAAVLAQGHVLIIGVPGLAKTLLVRTLASALGWTFKRIQFTPDMMPSDIIGMELLHEDRTEAGGASRAMRFVPGPIFANLVLADEINRTPPRTQSALLEAMQELTVTSMGRSYPLERPFIVCATQNPIEQEGTYPLPEAQLDRFMASLWLDYPSTSEEERIVSSTTSGQQFRLDAVFSRQEVLAFQDLVQRVPVSPHVVTYAVAVARATRPSGEGAGASARQYVQWGAGPRAGQHMVMLGKALAALDGLPAVSCDHIREAAPLVLRHRVLPNYQALGEGMTPASIVENILKSVKQPDYEK